MIPILYETGETLFTGNGICRLRDCISCRVTEGRNEVYEVEFDYPVDGANFSEIVLGRSVAVYHDESKTIQPFDLISYTKPIDGIVTFRGVHISYRLNRIVTSLRLSGNVQGVFAYMNTRGWGFNFSTDKQGSGNATAIGSGYPITVRQMLGGMEGSLLDTYGGEYEFDMFNVKLWNERGSLKDLTIRYGLNMTDYNEEMDFSDSYTKCVPYWMGQDINGNDKIVIGDTVDTGVISYNGAESCVPLDLSEYFENKPTKANLQSMALSMMSSRQTYLPEQNIKVDFIRLQDTEEYSQYATLMECNLCDSITVVFPRYKTRGTFKIVKVVYDVLAERYESMELGSLQTSLAEVINSGQGGERASNVEIVRVRHQILFASADDGAHITVNPGSYSEGTYTVTKDGYYPLGIVGHAFSGTGRFYMSMGCKERLASVVDGSCAADIVVTNNGTSAWSGGLFVDILWAKI